MPFVRRSLSKWFTGRRTENAFGRTQIRPRNAIEVGVVLKAQKIVCILERVS
jgi:hypothetical protein